MKIHESVFVAPGAHLIGDVTIGENSSVWYNAVLRGDEISITIGENTNIQDGVIMHGDHGDHIVVGDYVTVGHGAIVHGCTVGDNVLIGMGAIVLNGARVGNNAVVGAGAVVPVGMEIPDGMIALGCPAKVKGPVKEAMIEDNRINAIDYVEHAAQAKKRLEGC